MYMYINIYIHVYIYIYMYMQGRPRAVSGVSGNSFTCFGGLGRISKCLVYPFFSSSALAALSSKGHLVFGSATSTGTKVQRAWDQCVGRWVEGLGAGVWEHSIGFRLFMP